MNRLNTHIGCLVIACMLLGGVGFCEDDPEKAEVFASRDEKLSYAFGIDAARSLKSLPLEVDVELFIRGIRDVYDGNELLITPEEAVETKGEFFEEKRKEHAKFVQEMAKKNKQEAMDFLEANKDKEGVITLSSGLQYKVLKETSGPKPTREDTVTVHYKGTLLDGTVFDSSYDRGTPATFPLRGVIAGWQEILPYMSIGSKYEVYIPPSLAYGTKGAGNMIGPNALLLFEIELMGIEGIEMEPAEETAALEEIEQTEETEQVEPAEITKEAKTVSQPETAEADVAVKEVQETAPAEITEKNEEKAVETE